MLRQPQMRSESNSILSAKKNQEQEQQNQQVGKIKLDRIFRK